MAKLGFLGLGIMGLPMARNLVKSGHEVALWSHTKGKAEELAREGGKARAFGSAAEVAANSDYIFYCVGDSGMARDLVLGADGLLKGARKGAMIADCSTVAPALSREIHAACAAKGVRFLDAPCTGSVPGATNATLTFMVGGDQAVFEEARPYFEIMGKMFFYCGGPGMGLHAKLTQNLVLATVMMAFNEGIVLAAKAGVPPELMLDVLNNSAAKSGLIAYKAPFILDRNFSTNFSTKWMHKDVGMALETGKQLGVPLPVTGITQQMFQAAVSKGYGEADFCSTIKVLEELAGVEVKKS